MFNSRFIGLVLARAWDLVSLRRVISAAYGVIRSTVSSRRIVLTRARRQRRLLSHEILSLSSSHLISYYSILDNVSIAFVVTWTWDFIPYLVLGAASYLE